MKKGDWITIGFMGLITVIGLYMSIAFTVKIAQGLTLFGDSTNSSGAVETSVTSTDYIVLSLYWVLTVLVLALLVYTLFFKKINDEKPTRKEIVNGKTVIIKDSEEKDENK